jgi:SAM-dependent methyltransferase
MLICRDMRGPLLSGPLGGAPVLEALAGWLRGVAIAVIIGPLWLGETLAAEIPTLLLIEREERERARRVARRAAASGRRLAVAVAGAELPLHDGTVDALVIESIATLDAETAARWMSVLIPTLRPGGRLITADVTANPAVEARLAGLFLRAALTGISQERPRDGVVLTVGAAPAAALVATRFDLAR